MILARGIIEAMVNHAQFWAPEESCGLLAGDGEVIRMAYCLTNVERSPVRFTVSPAEHYRAILHAERSGWSIRGSFHSHPKSRAVPSPTDVAGALDPDWIYCIVGLAGPEPELGVYRIVDGEVREVPVEAVGGYS